MAADVDCYSQFVAVTFPTMYLLGPMTPHYRSLLLGTFLRASKDSDALIRASAVSNLGQVCQHLHFSLGPVMYEVRYLFQTNASFLTLMFRTVV